MKYNKRITAPNQNDYHYFSDNIFYNSGYGLPNCTCYAWGRWYELLNEKPKLCINNASDWYNYQDGYVRSQKPKLRSNSMLCWWKLWTCCCCRRNL